MGNIKAKDIREQIKLLKEMGPNDGYLVVHPEIYELMVKANKTDSEVVFWLWKKWRRLKKFFLKYN